MNIFNNSKLKIDADAPYVIAEFRGCQFFSGKDNKLEAALRLPRNRHGIEQYDSLNFSVIEKIVNTGDVCFDIGANIGIYSCVFSRLSGDSNCVHSFEPANHIRQKLIRNARLNSFTHLHVNDFGIGSEAAEKEFFEIKPNNSRGGVSSFVQNENYHALGDDSYEKRKVQVRTLDSYVQEHNISAIKFIKIDVEGFEMDAIRGAMDTISKLRPFILLEFDNKRHADDAEEMREFFSSLGYQGLEPHLKHGKLGFTDWNFEKTPKQRNVLLTP